MKAIEKAIAKYDEAKDLALNEGNDAIVLVLNTARRFLEEAFAKLEKQLDTGKAIKLLEKAYGQLDSIRLDREVQSFQIAKPMNLINDVFAELQKKSEPKCKTCQGSGIAKEQHDGGTAELFCDCPIGEQKLEAFLKDNPDCRPAKPEPTELVKELINTWNDYLATSFAILNIPRKRGLARKVNDLIAKACDIIDRQAAENAGLEAGVQRAEEMLNKYRIQITEAEDEIKQLKETIDNFNVGM